LRPISIKVNNLLKHLGGVQKAIDYLLENGEFTNIPGIGRATDVRLQEYLKKLIDLQPSEEFMLLEDESNIHEIIIYYETFKEHCSIRMKNVLIYLEKINRYEESMSTRMHFFNTHFLQPFDFLNLRYSGKKTASELNDLRIKLIEHYKALSLGNKQILPFGSTDKFIDKNKLSKEPDEVFKLLIDKYEFYKFKCNFHTINFLNELENKEHYQNNAENKILFIEKHLLQNYNYNSFRGLNKIITKDLKSIQKEILIKYKSNDSSFITIKNDSSPLTKFLQSQLNNPDINSLKISDNFSLQKIFYVLLSQVTLSGKSKLVFERYILFDSNIVFKEIAKKCNCTFETVRSTLQKIRRTEIPALVLSINPYRNELEIENVYSNNLNNYYVIENIEEFDFGDNKIIPHFKLFSLFLSFYFKQDYFLLNDYSPLENNYLRVFECKNKSVLISKEFNEIANFLKLIEFLEEEIFAFETYSFDYNLKVLIKRFYIENGLQIENNLLESLYNLISIIKNEEIKIDLAKLKKLENKSFKENIKLIIQDLLINKKQAQKTNVLIEELSNNNIGIESSKLLNLLNKWPQTFVRVGNGAWGLKEWLTSKAIKGSVREIVEKLLDESESPLHISEILSFFNSYRPISETSLISNIKASENIYFQMFNCSFIGLKNKEYDKFWYGMPRFSGGEITSVVKNQSLTFSEKISELENKGYPKIHCEYILNKHNKETYNN
jgi:hypothetical protein